jgi:hypothetical protein
MCLSILDKYIKKSNSLFKVSLIEFVVDHDMVNVNQKRHKFHIICYVHYNEHHDPIFLNKKTFIVIFIFDNEDILKGHLSTCHNIDNMHEKKIV